jgi:hypothetical protein
MSTEGDLLRGIFKPVKDTIGAIALNAILSMIIDLPNSTPTFSENIGFSFNIWIFVSLFALVAYVDDMGSQIYADAKKSRSEPVDQISRLTGIFVGMIVFGGPLEILFLTWGGTLEEAALSWVMVCIILLFTTFIRGKIKKIP